MKNTTTTSLLSLTAVCFFAPMVQHTLKHNDFWLDEQQTKTIRWYISYGYGCIIQLLVLILASIMQALHQSLVLQLLTILLTISTITSLIIWMIFIFSNKQLNNKTTQANTETETTEQLLHSTNFIINFIPLYNLYIRYTQTHTTSYQKEWILWRTAFIVLTILDPSNTVSVIILVAMVVRITSLMTNIDIYKPLNNICTSSFEKHPEELRGHLLDRWQHKINLSRQKKTIWPTTKNTPISTLHQQSYQQVYDFSYRGHYVVYAVAFLILISALYHFKKNINITPLHILDVLAILLIILRLIIWLILQKAVVIPFLHEMMTYHQNKHLQQTTSWWKSQ